MKCLFQGCTLNSAHVGPHVMEINAPQDGRVSAEEAANVFQELSRRVHGLYHPKDEAVNHPPHYGGDIPHEHVKCATAWGLVENAFLYNASKYIARAGKKGPIVEDLKKAIWYLEAAIRHEEARQ